MVGKRTRWVSGVAGLTRQVRDRKGQHAEQVGIIYLVGYGREREGGEGEREVGEKRQQPSLPKRDRTERERESSGWKLKEDWFVCLKGPDRPLQTVP